MQQVGIWNEGGFGTRPYRFTPQPTLLTNHPQIRYNQQNFSCFEKNKQLTVFYFS